MSRLQHWIAVIQGGQLAAGWRGIEYIDYIDMGLKPPRYMRSQGADDFDVILEHRSVDNDN